ncbi:hypothetical protein JOB18_042230 [Solea senegalensis]|uniref:Uncharacterized protein n=1 Tax=Solea senegalensis TaxID=28829 RepID=A0AAV6SVC1_SOLSE|nr:hypothetical protein JOB18_042230 [Solea senegalensis]
MDARKKRGLEGGGEGDTRMEAGAQERLEDKYEEEQEQQQQQEEHKEQEQQVQEQEQQEEEQHEQERQVQKMRAKFEGKGSEENINLPIPSPDQKLPRPKENWEAAEEENWDMATEYRELRRQKNLQQEQEQERSWVNNGGENEDTEGNYDNRDDDDDAESGSIERPLPGIDLTDPVSQRELFSFLTSTLSVEQLGDDESESGGSQSDGSVSAASISGLSLAATGAGRRGAVVLPGPWLTPSQQRSEQVTARNRRPGGQKRQGRGRSAVSSIISNE